MSQKSEESDEEEIIERPIFSMIGLLVVIALAGKFKTPFKIDTQFPTNNSLFKNK